jgi:uncharacterized membrane protein YcaP (DUF421 family)
MTIQWHDLFGLTLSPWELVVRGSAMYLFLFVLFRVVIRRRIGAIGVADILVLVIIADAAQNAMSGDYRTITEGAILVSTIVAWDLLIDWLEWRSPVLHRLLEPPPLPLVHQGRVQYRNLRSEYMTLDELLAKLRAKGVAELAEVERAVMESDGEVSVIRRRARSASSR